jgi:DNA-binding MurR/RpiR family transcriptional regulator
MTGGTGVDTYIYTAVTHSQGTKIDVITNFQVGTGGDVIDLSGVTGGTGQFLGVANGYGAVLMSLTGSAGDTVLDASTSTLYIDVNGDGALDSADMAIQLTGVTSGLVADNFVF